MAVLQTALIGFRLCFALLRGARNPHPPSRIWWSGLRLRGLVRFRRSCAPLPNTRSPRQAGRRTCVVVVWIVGFVEFVGGFEAEEFAGDLEAEAHPLGGGSGLLGGVWGGVVFFGGVVVDTRGEALFGRLRLILTSGFTALRSVAHGPRLPA